MLLWFWELAAGCVVTTPAVQVKLHAWMECNARDVCYHHNRTHLLTINFVTCMSRSGLSASVSTTRFSCTIAETLRDHGSEVPLEAAGVGLTADARMCCSVIG
jgi:hypothetical protein